MLVRGSDRKGSEGELMNIIPYGQTIYGQIAAMLIGLSVVLCWIFYYREVDREEKAAAKEEATK